MKQCRQCGVVKGLVDFARDKSKADGHVNQCKECRNAYSKVRYETKKPEIMEKKAIYRSLNRHLARENTARWAAENPLMRRASKASYRARKRGAAGAHTADDVRELLELQKGKCAMCTTDIRASFQIDHIQPLARGGTNDRLNLQLLCGHCNASKGARDPLLVARSLGRLL